MRLFAVLCCLVLPNLWACEDAVLSHRDAALDGDLADGGIASDVGPLDAGADAGPRDGGADAGTDVGTDSGTDVGVDAGPATPCPRARVTTPGETLNVRPAPNTSMAPTASLPDGYIVDVVDMVRGEEIGGVDLWFQIGSPAGDGFVFSTFVTCTEEMRPMDDGAYYAPFACGTSHRVSQAPGGGTSHTGRSMWAFDFAMGLNTPVHAMRAGTVTFTHGSTGPGDPCYSGGGPECNPATNFVIIQHADRSTAAYLHLNGVEVTVGTMVPRGARLGVSGSTGYSTGPHLHAEVRGNCPTSYCTTVAFTMVDVGSPAAGTTVTSGNCP